VPPSPSESNVIWHLNTFLWVWQVVTGQDLQLNAAGFGGLDANFSSSLIITGFGGQLQYS